MILIIISGEVFTTFLPKFNFCAPKMFGVEKFSPSQRLFLIQLYFLRTKFKKKIGTLNNVINCSPLFNFIMK